MRIPAVLGALALAGLLAACGTSNAAPKAQPSSSTTSANLSISGTLLLYPGTDELNPCAPTGGYSDIQDGAAVTIENAQGTVIATAVLSNASNNGSSCAFDWIATVPRSTFYKVEISHRGQLTYSLAQVQQGDLQSTLGDVS